MGALTPTCDPFVFIEEQREGYVIYQALDGRRWSVSGVCDGNRACMVGAVVDGMLIETVEQAWALPTPELDCPVGPGFSGCCDLRVTVL